MALRDSLRRLMGNGPVDVGRLDREATRQEDRPSLRPGMERAGDDIEVTEEYAVVRKLLEGGASAVFVTGNAGTGKTTLIRYVVNALDKACAVVAPTGVAALNIGGATIHSFCRLPPRIHEDRDIRELPDRRLLRRLELLIIDEISMVRCDLLDAVDKSLRLNRSSEEPFGGVSLLLVGDMFQLPPVVEEEERPVLESRGYRSPYFFSSLALQESGLFPMELTRVFRQTDPEFVRLLNHIRIGESGEEVLNAVNRQCVHREKAQGAITLTPTNRLADTINEAGMAALPGPPRTYMGKVTGEFKPGRDKVPSPYDLTLKVGARVMFTKNDELRRWVNGTLGEVERLEEDAVFVRTAGTAGNVVHSVGPVTWNKYRYVYDSASRKIVAKKVGSYRQFPLMPAWAVTIHKSQGKTLDSVLVDFGAGTFAPGQAYVALSRCRRLEDVHLVRPLRASDIRCDPVVRRFYEGIERQMKGR